MILHINVLFLYGSIVLVMILVSITTIIAYRKETDTINKDFLSLLMIPVGLIICVVPIFVYEMFRFLLNKY